MRNEEKWLPLEEPRGPSTAWGVQTEGGKVIIPASTRLDGQDVMLICRTHNARLEQPDMIYVKPIVSRKTGQPVIQYAYGEQTWEHEYATAHIFIRNIQAALEAGITDAFMAKWIREVVAPGASPEEQAHMTGNLLREFREFRDLVQKPLVEETDAVS